MNHGRTTTTILSSGVGAGQAFVEQLTVEVDAVPEYAGRILGQWQVEDVGHVPAVPVCAAGGQYNERYLGEELSHAFVGALAGEAAQLRGVEATQAEAAGALPC